MNFNKFAFIDRDGVINVEKGYLFRPEEFEYCKGALTGLKNLILLGFKLIIITNQAGIARGYYSLGEYKVMEKFIQDDLDENGVTVSQTLYCPHHPSGVVKEYSIVCDCRKPKIGMIKKFGILDTIDYENSIFVGDKYSDIECGHNLGLKELFIVKSGHSFQRQEMNFEYQIYKNLHEVSLDLRRRSNTYNRK